MVRYSVVHESSKEHTCGFGFLDVRGFSIGDGFGDGHGYGLGYGRGCGSGRGNNGGWCYTFFKAWTFVWCDGANLEDIVTNMEVIWQHGLL